MKRRNGLTRGAARDRSREKSGLTRADLKVIDLSKVTAGALPHLDNGPIHPPFLQEITDRFLALLAVICLLPLYSLVGFLVRLTSPGPIIYRQVRIGLNRRSPLPVTSASNSFYDVYDRRTLDLPGKPFIIYKFRTMVDGAENRVGPIWATRNDPRITFLGKILRHLRIDETPQFFNVLRGDMSLVGPRPERPTFVRDLIGEMPDYALRLRVKPGITGLAQVEHQYDTCLDDVKVKLEYDLDYVSRKGWLQDFRILLRTVVVVLTGKGAQ